MDEQNFPNYTVKTVPLFTNIAVICQRGFCAASESICCLPVSTAKDKQGKMISSHKAKEPVKWKNIMDQKT